MNEIRLAQSDDADALCDAHVAAWRVGYRGIIADEYLDSDQFETARRSGWHQRQWLDSKESTLFVAVIDGRVVGFGYVGPEPYDGAATGRGEVYSFYLHPTAWGSGIAGELMLKCEAELRASGFTEAVLTCLRDNPRARAFYEKAGWAWTGVEKTWDGPTMPGLEPLGPLADVVYGREL